MKRNLKHAPSAMSGEGDHIQDIIQAALDGNASLVRDLLERGEDINTVEPKRGFTCLHIACSNGDDAVVDELLSFNAKSGGLDFSIQTFDPPRYAWQLAMSAHHYDLAERVDQAGRAGESPKPAGPKLVR